MASRHRAHRLTVRQRLGNNPRLVCRAPGATPTSSGEDLDPPNRLRDNTMLTVHSKPNDPNQIVDSQNHHQSERWDRHIAYVRCLAVWCLLWLMSAAPCADRQ